jgi:hypothetical protein
LFSADSGRDDEALCLLFVASRRAPRFREEGREPFLKPALFVPIDRGAWDFLSSRLSR